jgi:N-acetylneuraminic acid mutarotase
MDQTMSVHLAAFKRTLRATIQLSDGARRIGFLVVLCLGCLTLSSACRAEVVQKRVWVWMGGNVPQTATNNGESGVYGTLGVPAAANIPGGRGSALSWTDGSGNLWLFGGQALSPAGTNEYLNDLWEYSPTTGEWAWMSGSDTAGSNGGQPGVYGTPGRDLATNVPGGRDGLVGWSDSNGNLWLFGGYGYDSAGTLGYLNDLWKFNPATGKWTWMGGSSTVPISDGGQTGVYGTLGVSSTTNQPGSRSAMVSWIDGSGNFWLFGGNGFDSTGTRGDLNDLWKYSPATNQWTWISGSNLANQSGVYRTMGAASAASIPSGRAGASSWIDGSGNLWLFGGGGSGSVGMNDLWEFTPSTGQWAWMSGDNTPGQSGVYGTMGVASSTNVPGGRICANAWIDSDGNLWLFGGAGFDSTGMQGFLDDLWMFSPSTNQWMWMNGSSTSDQSAVYGTLATPSSLNTPGSRYSPTSWSDGNGDLWLFGGWYKTPSGNNSYLSDDLWEAGVPASAPTFSPAAGSYTATQTVTIADAAASAAIYYTTDGTTPTASSTLYTGPITVSSTETVEAIAVLPGSLNSAPASATYTLILSTTATPTFSPAAGSYNAAQTVTIGDTTPNATIYYTTDGSTPRSISSVYTGPIPVSSTETLRAFAVVGSSPSSVATATYTIAQTVGTPIFSVAAGSYTTAQTVSIGDATTTATICYTTDGSTPTTASTVYTGPITVSSTETLTAVAFKSGYTQSAVATAAYTIAQTVTAVPTFSPAAGSYSTAQTVAIYDTTPNAIIYYTTDGSTPTSLSAVYSGPITVSSTETLEARAIASGYSVSNIVTAAYSISQGVVPTPIFSVAAGSYTTAQTVSIGDATTTATICYTTDGSTPTSVSTVYAGPITVSSTETLKAIAYKSGYTQSAVATATYVFQITPTITWPTPAAISYGTPLDTAQLDATASVSGTFAYTPTTGTLLPVGSNTLSAVFTPKNLTEYTTATASVTLIVNVPTNPVPTIGSISPAFVNAGSPAFTLTVNGSGFVAGSVLYWGSTALVTQVVGATQLTASVPAESIANAGVTALSVQSPTPGGGVSNALLFEVDSNAAGTTTPPSFSSTAVVVAAGTNAIYPVTLPATITTQSVTCLNLPAGATCSYSATTNRVTITTSANTPKGVYQITVVFSETTSVPVKAFVFLPILLLPLLFARRRWIAARRIWLTASLCLVFLAATLFTTGCGSSIFQSVNSTASSVVSLTIQ